MLFGGRHEVGSSRMSTFPPISCAERVLVVCAFSQAGWLCLHLLGLFRGISEGRHLQIAVLKLGILSELHSPWWDLFMGMGGGGEKQVS